MTLEEFNERHSPTVRLWFLSLAVADMNASESAARRAIQLIDEGDKDGPLSEALSEVSVVRYFRPFTKCRLPDGKKSIRLPREIVPFEFSDLHETVGTIRDQNAAHSDMSARSAYIRRHRRSDDRPLMWQALTVRSSLDDNFLRQMPLLTYAMRERLLPIVNQLADALIATASYGQIFECLIDSIERSNRLEKQYRRTYQD